MRIEAYNQVAQIYGAQKTTAKAKANKTTSMGRDEVQISSFGKDLQVAKAAMKNSAEVFGIQSPAGNLQVIFHLRNIPALNKSVDTVYKSTFLEKRGKF